MREWMIRHPDLVAGLCAALVASVVADVFGIGQEIGAARAMRGEADRIASEAMGG